MWISPSPRYCPLNVWSEGVAAPPPAPPPSLIGPKTAGASRTCGCLESLRGTKEQARFPSFRFRRLSLSLSFSPVPFLSSHPFLPTGFLLPLFLVTWFGRCGEDPPTYGDLTLHCVTGSRGHPLHDRSLINTGTLYHNTARDGRRW